jgi:CARDB.
MKKYFTIVFVFLFSSFGITATVVGSGVEKSKAEDVLFTSDFSSATDFNEKWNVIDGNGDGTTWGFNGSMQSVDGTNGAAVCYTYTTDVEDYLVTKTPLALEAGGHYVTFQLRAMMLRSEAISLLYGTSSDPTEMTEVIYVNEDFTNTTFAFIANNFNVATAGNYYFAFKASSTAGNSQAIVLDDVTINRGSYGTEPDLAVSNIVLPTSACGLGIEDISCTITNVGTADVENFVIYVLVNGAIANMVPVNELIPAGQSKVISMEDVVDFSEVGTYKVMIGSVCELDLNDENDFAEAEVTHYSPITEFPKNYNFSQAQDANEWIPESANGWGLGGGGWASRLPNYPITSRCFGFEKNTYQISITYSAGDETDGASFKILAGLTGTDISAWQTVREFTNEKSSGITRTASFAVEEAGTYSFAILVSENMITVSGFAVNMGVANDIAIESWDVKPEFTKMPVEHLTAGYNFSATITNTGTANATGVKIVISGKDDTVLGESETSTLTPNETKIFEATSAISGFEIGETASIKINALMNETDGNPNNNIGVFNFAVTDSILSLDNGTKREFADINVKGDYGILMHFVATDTITSINIDWGINLYGANDFSLSLYRVQYPSGLLTDKLFTINSKRPVAGIEENYLVPNHILEPGYYYIEISQPTEASLNIGVDLDARGYFYSTSALQSEGYYLTEPQIGYGNLLIRPCFGRERGNKDIEVVSIDTPNISTGLFSNNQSVSATIKNNGKSISEFKVYCTVNDGEPVEKIITGELLSDRTMSVEFEMNLSVAVINTVKVYVNENDDVNTENNAVTRIFYNMEPGAYVMDFESCVDFANEIFNPQWTTFDGDGVPTVEFQNTFPNMQRELGFIAFNPASTVPALTNEYIQPFKGAKFGASLRIENGQRNDWLISPKLLLGDNSKLVFQAKTFYAPGLPVELPEIFNILVSTTDNQPESFTLLSGSNIAPTNWKRYEFDLSAYDNQEAHIAIQCVTEEGLIFMIDNIEILPPRQKEQNIKNIDAVISVYPNPVSDILHVNTGGIRVSEIVVSNIFGSIVYQNTPNNSGEHKINVSNFVPGVYVITLKSEGRNSTQMFIVK